jgi:uncharacterized protein YbdZ (MbtH family)
VRVYPGRQDTVHLSLNTPVVQAEGSALAIAPRGVLHSTGWQLMEPAHAPVAVQVYVALVWTRVYPGRQVTEQVLPKTPAPQAAVLALAMAPRAPHCIGWQLMLPAHPLVALQVYVALVWTCVNPGRHDTVQLSPKNPEPQLLTLALVNAPRGVHATRWQLMLPSHTPVALQV